MSRVIIFASLGLLGCALIAVVVSRAVQASDDSDAGMAQTFPMHCTAHQKLTIKDANYNGPVLGIDPAVITADDGCELTIIDSKIASPTGIAATSNVKITLQNSSITAKNTAIDLGSNGSLVATGTSAISGRDAILGSVDTTIALTDTEVDASGSDIRGNNLLNVQMTNVKMTGATPIAALDGVTLSIKKGSTIHATATGITVENNAKIDVEDSTITAGTVAIETRKGAQLTLLRSTVSGARASIATEGAPSQETTTGSTLTGPRLVDGKSVAGAAAPAKPHS